MKVQKLKKVLTSVEQLSESNKDYVLGLLDGLKLNKLQKNKYQTYKPVLLFASEQRDMNRQNNKKDG